MVLTFHLEVDLACEVIALPDDTGVPAAVSYLGVLDGQSEKILVGLDGELGPTITLLKSSNNKMYQINRERKEVLDQICSSVFKGTSTTCRLRFAYFFQRPYHPNQSKIVFMNFNSLVFSATANPH